MRGEELRSSESSFTSAMALTQSGALHVPQHYVLPPSQRPNIYPTNVLINPSCTTSLPIIDLSSLQNPSLRSQVIDEIRIACKEIGFFQLIHHGVSPLVMKDALDAAAEFFNLPMEEKMLLGSDNVNEPVRYGTSLNHVKDKVHFWRDFIKQYSHPISKWIHLWPSKPPSYR
ncbi:Non-heme dioxygenase N-terminal domain containing protein [Parasponia andersonii]|uniref:Non-heme dioxygenase N-terminal domain containing protein n=1 Tax=Parasponia andersonii TaxID=3476 RepID=A0A2P5CCM6_PARAD|nr:Non-heme dioxygenase N-terminal domain containing protein [Parasponia andersonii]